MLKWSDKLDKLEYIVSAQVKEGKDVSHMFSLIPEMDEGLEFIWRAFCLLRKGSNGYIPVGEIITFVNNFGFIGVSSELEFIEVIREIDLFYMQKVSDANNIPNS